MALIGCGAAVVQRKIQPSYGFVLVDERGVIIHGPMGWWDTQKEAEDASSRLMSEIFGKLAEDPVFKNAKLTRVQRSEP